MILTIFLLSCNTYRARRNSIWTTVFRISKLNRQNRRRVVVQRVRLSNSQNSIVPCTYIYIYIRNRWRDRYRLWCIILVGTLPVFLFYTGFKSSKRQKTYTRMSSLYDTTSRPWLEKYLSRYFRISKFTIDVNCAFWSDAQYSRHVLEAASYFAQSCYE